MKNFSTKDFEPKLSNKGLDKAKTFIQDTLNSITNLDDKLTNNPNRRPHQQIDDITKLSYRRVPGLDKKARKLADEYFRKFYLRNDDQKDSQKLPSNAARAKLEINSLANLIQNKKPQSKEEERLALLDKLFDFRREAEEFRIRDEIARLQILLIDEETKLKNSETKENRGFITELKNQIIQLSKEVF
jgi:polyhydroxyalkanoate synthesis regulator phasin